MAEDKALTPEQVARFRDYAKGTTIYGGVEPEALADSHEALRAELVTERKLHTETYFDAADANARLYASLAREKALRDAADNALDNMHHTHHTGKFLYNCPHGACLAYRKAKRGEALAAAPEEPQEQGRG